MNPEPTGPEKLEARISALLLGELEGAAAEEVLAAIEASPDLRRLRDRLQQTIDLVREATVPQPVIASASPLAAQLSEPRRAELLKRFKVVQLAESAAKRRKRSWWGPMAAAAGLTVALSLLSLSLSSWDYSHSAGAFDMAGYAGDFIASGGLTRKMDMNLGQQQLTPMTSARSPFSLLQVSPTASSADSEVEGVAPSRSQGDTEARGLAEAGMPVDELSRQENFRAAMSAAKPQSRGIAFPPSPPVPTLPAKTTSAFSAGQDQLSDGLAVLEDEPPAVAWRDYDNDVYRNLVVNNQSSGRSEVRTKFSEEPAGAVERLEESVARPAPLPGQRFAATSTLGGFSALDAPAPAAQEGKEQTLGFAPAENGRSLNRNQGVGEFTRLRAEPAAVGEERFGLFKKQQSLQEGIYQSGLYDAPNSLALESVDDKGLGAEAAKVEELSRGSTALGDRPTLGRLFAAAPESAPVPAAGAAVGDMVDARGRKDDARLTGETILGLPLQRFEEADKLGAMTDSGTAIATGTGSAGGSYFNAPAVTIAGADLNSSFGGGLGLTTNQANVGGIGGGGAGEPEMLQQVAATAEPQPEVQTAEQRVSTFSLNVSDVSFKLAAASLDNGVLPEPATVRTEEFINAFDYRDPEPAGDAAVALNWERGRYPFAHNRELLRFSVRTAAQGRASDRPLNLVLLLDNSGSMERADRVGIIREAMRVLANQIQPQDRVSVVSFARTPRLWVDGLSGTAAQELPDRVGELTPEGGTNLEGALDAAYETAARNFMVGGVNRVVLLTDGAANLGVVEPRTLQNRVESNRLKGIALDCFGIGWEGYNDDLLETLSRHGDGRYGFVNTPEEAATGFADQLAGALQIAAANVKVQVEFNPARVTAYRQLGYAKHQLTEEQFRDNTVDAAEIAAAESGNALYVAEVDAQGQGPIGVVRARYQDPATGEFHEQEWALPYLGPAPALETSSATLRLAGTAAAFAEWLARNPFAAEVAPDRLLRLLEGVPEAFDLDPRPEQLRRMITQGITLAGGSSN